MRGLPVRTRMRGRLLLLLLLLPPGLIPSSTTSPWDARDYSLVRTVQTAQSDTGVRAAHQRVRSPQGCASGAAPRVTQRAPITSARGAAGLRAEVALTFDDGPSPTFTPPILAALHAAGVHATFFVVGRHVARYPALVRAEWEGGNAIGNHTYDHNWVPGMGRDQLRATLAATTAAVRAATGDSCLWLFRPPFGALAWHSRGAGELRQDGWTTVDWSIDPKDWKRPGARVIAQRVIRQLGPGAIILLHDGAPDGQNADRSQTVAALRLILAALQGRGLQAVTLPQLLIDAGMARPAAPPSAPSAAPQP